MKFLSKVLNISAERFLKTAGDLFIYDGDYISALHMVDKTLELEPDDVRALVLRGDILYCLNRDHEALATFDTALAIDPYSVEALISRAGVLDILGKSREALTCCRKAFAQIKPYQAFLLPSLYDQTIVLLLRLKKHHEARALLKASEGKIPKDDYVELQTNYGHILDRLSRDRKQTRSHAKKLPLEVLSTPRQDLL